MTRQYRVVTTDMNGSISILTGWTTRRTCEKYIQGRWGHKPPFAHISSASTAKARRLYGFTP